MQNYYFIGAGGIGMANLERYFLSLGCKVGGYDRTPSPLTAELTAEGVDMIYEDDPSAVSDVFRNPADTVVVYTPAVPADSALLSYFRNGGFNVMKRARLLGEITRSLKSICVAGSHGKTTTCSMTANILRQPGAPGCNAFLGGILRNTGSNLVLCAGSEWAVIEADEYDRSFHHLSPTIAVVTSVDPDHLDIYGDEEGYLEGFSHFTSLIRKGGYLLMHTGLKLQPKTSEDVTVMTYSGGSEGDWHAEDIEIGDGKITFTLTGPDRLRFKGLSPGVPVEINVDNAVAAAAASILAGAGESEIREGLSTFKGAKRRFEIHLDGSEGTPVLIDDYAHSPNEIRASIRSVKKLFPGRHVSVIFQPHLYSRTRDFADDFALALSEADSLIMPEIYPARELPIPGVDSLMVLEKTSAKEKQYCERKDLLNLVKNSNFDVLMTLGAADIDLLLPDIKAILKTKKRLS